MPPVDTDPHFLIHVPQTKDTLCFNINEEPGVVLSLVQDLDTGTGDVTPSTTRGGAWTPPSSMCSCGQDSAVASTSHSLCAPVTRLGSTCLLLFHLPA